MKVYCDDRENGDVLKEFFQTGLDCEVKRLKCGDYVMDDVVIERKTIDDFCQSIIDGRLKAQIDRMVATFTHRYVVIIGKFSDRRAEINENCILGAISSLLVKDVSLACVETEKQFVYLAKRIFERFIKMKGGEKCQEKQ